MKVEGKRQSFFSKQLSTEATTDITGIRNKPWRKSQNSKDIKNHPRYDDVKARSPREKGCNVSPDLRTVHYSDEIDQRPCNKMRENDTNSNIRQKGKRWQGWDEARRSNELDGVEMSTS